MTATAPKYLGDQIQTFTSDDGRFVVYKTDAGIRGGCGHHRGAAPFTPYSMLDVTTGRVLKAKNLKTIHCMIHHARTGEQTAPWFSQSANVAPRAVLVKVLAE